MDEGGSGLLVLGLLLALWYGYNQHSRAEDLQSKLQTAQSQITDLKSKATALEEASDNLQQQMTRFDSENWRDVVGDARGAAEEVDSAKDELKESADNADADRDAEADNDD